MPDIVGRMRIILPVLLLAGCASTPEAASDVAAGAGGGPVAAPVGLEGVVGRNAASLVARFGPPALDVREGSARKLQFANQVCILDAYLYPRAGREPAVTHVDARMPDGRDIDRASCAASLSLRD